MSKLQVAMYHYVRDLKNSRYPNIKGMDYQLFKEQIAFFKKEFNIVTMQDVIAAWNSKSAKDILPPNALLLTFDDGYIDNYTVVFPILMENNIQGSFFIPGKTFNENVLLDVNKIHFLLASADINSLVQDVFYKLDSYRSDFPEVPSNDVLFDKYAIANRFDSKETIFVKRILQTAIPEELRNIVASELFKKYVGLSEDVFSRELYMNREQIRCMKNAGMFIGIHGYDHYWLGNLSEEQMKKDIDQSLISMDEFIDKDKWVINYPYGSYNDKVLEYIEQRGCKLAMTTEVNVANTEVHNRFLIPRLDCNDYPPKSQNYLKY